MELQDLAPDDPPPVPVSAIVVVEGSGERSVVSVTDALEPAARERAELVDLSGAGCLLLDGFHLDVAIAVAERARRAGVPVVLDGGSWKNGLERLLPLVDWAVCSERFAPPDGSPRARAGRSGGRRHLRPAPGSVVRAAAGPAASRSLRARPPSTPWARATSSTARSA